MNENHLKTEWNFAVGDFVDNRDIKTVFWPADKFNPNTDVHFIPSTVIMADLVVMAGIFESKSRTLITIWNPTEPLGE